MPASPSTQDLFPAQSLEHSSPLPDSPCWGLPGGGIRLNFRLKYRSLTEHVLIQKLQLNTTEIVHACQFWFVLIVDVFQHLPQIRGASHEVVDHPLDPISDFPCLKELWIMKWIQNQKITTIKRFSVHWIQSRETVPSHRLVVVRYAWKEHLT